MKKYRLFVATYSYLNEVASSVEFDYEVITVTTEGDADYELKSTHENANDALEAAAKVQPATELKPLIVKRPKVKQFVHSITSHFDSDSSAHAWLRNQAESRNDPACRCEVETVILNQDEIDELVYSPSYSVELLVTQTRRITVEIDTDDYPDVEDTYDAEQQAIDNARDGDYDYEIDGEPVDDVEFEADYSEEL